MSGDRWTITPAVAVTARADRDTSWAGESTLVTVTITNHGDQPVTGAALAAQLPAGWQVEPMPALEDIPAGKSVTLKLRVTDVEGSPGRAFLSFTLCWGGQPATGGVVLEVSCGKPSSPKFVSVSDERTWGEPEGSGPGASAVDRDPLTYWHSNWDKVNTPYPHHLVVDTGKVQDLCGLSYLPRDLRPRRPRGHVPDPGLRRRRTLERAGGGGAASGWRLAATPAGHQRPLREAHRHQLAPGG